MRIRTAKVRLAFALALAVSATCLTMALPSPSLAVTWGPWSSATYHYVQTTKQYYEYKRAYQLANYSSTWQTTSTWPQGRWAQMHRRAYNWVNGYGWVVSGDEIRMSGPFGIWWIDCTVLYRYNYYNVYTDNSTTCSYLGVGFGLSVTPVTWNDGGNYYGYMMWGANYSVSFAYSGSPMTAGHWFRHTINVNGTFGALSFT
jgi:hypothetical protein